MVGKPQESGALRSETASVAVGHACWEAEFFEGVIALFALHGGGVARLNGIVLRSDFVKSNFVQDSVTQGV